MSKQAHILALRADTLAGGLDFGIRPLVDGSLSPLLDAQAWIGPRPILEGDPSFIQIIPYVLIRQGGRILSYLRTASGGEERLHGKFSVGVGGHIDLPDIAVDEAIVEEKGEKIPVNRIDILRTLTRASIREIVEEIGMDIPEESLHWTHLIHTAATPVDAVHLGLVAIIDIDEAGIPALVFEEAIGNACFEVIAELAAGRVAGEPAEAENWTRLVLDMLVEAATQA